MLLLFQPLVGGVPNYVANLAEGLTDRGWDVSVAAPSGTPVLARLRSVAGKVIALDTQAGASPLSDARVFGELVSLCRRRRVDVIHAHSSKAGALAALLGRLIGTPSVYTPHGWSFQRELSGPAERAYVTVERALGRRHARVIAVAGAERVDAARTKVVDPARVHLVHTGLRDAVLPDRGWARSQLGLDPEAFVVGWVGRTGRQKRSEQLPVLARELSGEATVAALGFGLADSDAGRELRALGGIVTASVDPEVIYAASDAIAVTSRWEGLPLVALEAMRAGLPVVGYEVGGLPEQVDHGVTGYLVEPGDVMRMALKLAGLARDRKLANRMGLAARRRFLSQFSFERMVSGIEETYRHVNEMGGLVAPRVLRFSSEPRPVGTAPEALLGTRRPQAPRATEGGRAYGRRSQRTAMNVVMVTNNALEDKVGGHERYVRELASTLSDRGLAVTIVAKRWSADSPPREHRSDGVVIERYAVPSKRNPLYAPAYLPYVMRGVAARVNRHTDKTIIHAHMALPALPLAVRRHPFLLTFHAPVWRELLSERQGSYLLPGVIQRPTVGTLRRAESFVARGATGTVVLSEFMRGELAVLDPGAARQAVLIPGGLDERRFHPDGRAPLADRDRMPVLFTARRLTPRTGVDVLIRATAQVAMSRPDVQLKIAGAGAMRPALTALSRELGIAQSVEFLGRISDEELSAWYRRASLVVIPTRELEGFGLTTAEALACGAAVIGTPVGATPELLHPLDPVLVTDDISAGAIAGSVLRLLDDPDRLQQIRAAASRRVLPSMTWTRVADRYLDLYERLIP